MRFNDILEDFEFYADAHDPTVTYAEVVVPAMGVSQSPYKIFAEIDDEIIKSYIRQFVLPNSSVKSSVTELLKEVKDNIALGGNPDTVAPRVRTAGKLLSGLMEYDLNTPFHEYIKVTPDGWNVVRKTKHKFLKRNTLGVQILPRETDKNLLDLLMPLVNTDRDGLILFATWLVQAYCMGNHSALLVEAPAGSSKSTLTKIARRIVDPSRLQTNVMSEKKEDLFAVLSNSYFVAWDNMAEQMSRETSDILCAAITGATMAKRKLYTTNELGVYELHNVILLNGLDITPSQSDFASRCLLLKLNIIDEKDRKTDSEMEELFQSLLPEILGSIFNTLVSAMKIIDQISPTRRPRMLESYKEMLAIAVALDIEAAEFERIYFDNIAALDKARSNIAIVEAVQEYMNTFVTGRSIEGKVTDLYTKICANYSGSKKDLPKSASHFSRKLRQEFKTFDAANLTINLDDTPADGTRLKIIKNK